VGSPLFNKCFSPPNCWGGGGWDGPVGKLGGGTWQPVLQTVAGENDHGTQPQNLTTPDLAMKTGGWGGGEIDRGVRDPRGTAVGGATKPRKRSHRREARSTWPLLKICGLNIPDNQRGRPGNPAYQRGLCGRGPIKLGGDPARGTQSTRKTDFRFLSSGGYVARVLVSAPRWTGV